MEKYVTLEEYREMWQSLREFLIHLPAGTRSVNTVMEGVKLPLAVASLLEPLKHFEVRQDDVWVVTYPKAGTTWAQEIISCAIHEGNLEEVKAKHTMFRVLFLEMNLPDTIRQSKNLPLMHEIAEEMPSPRVFKTHLPGHFLPLQSWQKKPKIVYVMRNPKDVVVSFFYFLKMMNPTPVFLKETFGEFFDRMLTGSEFYGPWWDHYLFFWRKRDEPNVLLLRYEEMKKDLRGSVEKICQFLGKKLSAEKMDAIAEHCTFDNMKKNPMSNQDYVFVPDDSPHRSMRKGIVGDWKTHFTVAQNEAMDALIEEKLGGTGLTFDYD